MPAMTVWKQCKKKNIQDSYYFVPYPLLSLTESLSIRSLSSPWGAVHSSWGSSQRCSLLGSAQFSSVAQLCLTLCDSLDCSMSGFPVHHQFLEFAQTLVHWVSDAIQPSHPVIPFSSCLQSFPASGSFPMSHFFTSCDQSIGASASVLPMNIQDWFLLGLSCLISLQSKRLSRVFSNITFKSINSLVLSFLYIPTLISIHDYWKNHSLD